MFVFSPILSFFPSTLLYVCLVFCLNFCCLCCLGLAFDTLILHAFFSCCEFLLTFLCLCFCHASCLFFYFTISFSLMGFISQFASALPPVALFSVLLQFFLFKTQIWVSINMQISHSFLSFCLSVKRIFRNFSSYFPKVFWWICISTYLLQLPNIYLNWPICNSAMYLLDKSIQVSSGLPQWICFMIQ